MIGRATTILINFQLAFRHSGEIIIGLVIPQLQSTQCTQQRISYGNLLRRKESFQTLTKMETHGALVLESIVLKMIQARHPDPEPRSYILSFGKDTKLILSIGFTIKQKIFI